MSRPGQSDGDPSRARSRLPFVGRDWEVAQLEVALDEALGGRAQIAVLTGEPGIGKTRLVEELCALAASRGAVVHWGRCDEWDDSPAYWPWVQLLGPIVGRLESEGSMPWGSGTSQLGQIVRAPAPAGDDVTEPTRGDTRQARFDLFREVVAVLEQAASQRPLALVIDDLHWADKASLELLRFVARSLRNAPVLLLATCRQSEVGSGTLLGEVLSALAREPGHQRLTLRALSWDDVAEFIERSTHRTLEPSLVDAVFDAAGGNPFFMREVVRLLGSGDAARAPDGTIHVPETVRDVVSQRVARLPAACLRQLEVASVIGREFGFALLSDISGGDAAPVVDDLEPAVVAGLVETTDAAGYRFSHALVRDALYESLPTPRRLALHRDVGEALERRLPGEPGTNYAALALHFGIAAPLDCADKAVAYALQAADDALVQHAWETAVAQYQRALRALDLLPGADPARRCDTLLMLGEAQTLAGAGRERAFLEGSSPEAIDTFWHAAHLAQAAGSPDQLARAALGIAGHSLGTPQAGQEGIELMAAALASLPPDDSHLRALLLARLTVDSARGWSVGGHYLAETDPAWIVRQSDEAVEIARRIGDARTLAFTLAAKRLAREGSGRLEAWLDDAGEILRLAGETGDLQIAIWGLVQKHVILIERGDPAAARVALDALSERVERAPTPMLRNQVAFLRSGEALRSGRFDEADALLQQSRAAWPRTAIATFQLATLRREQDRLAEVTDLVQERHDRLPRSAQWRAFMVLRWLEAGDIERARELYDDIAARDYSDLPRGVVWLRSVSWLAEAAWAFRDAPRATLIYDMLVPFAERNLFAENSDHTGGAVAYYLGLLAMTMEYWDDADRHFSDALAKNEAWKQRPYAAYTRHAWADMLLRRGHGADRERAIRLNAEALDAAESMGMTRLARLARALAAVVHDETVPGTVAPHRLSARELDVLRLIVAGRTDRDIADALFISPRTVGSHVSNILGKLGAVSRTEATARAVRDGLV